MARRGVQVPRRAVILGSGLGHPADLVLQQNGLAIDYGQIPGMPCSAITGHAGRLVIGGYGSTDVIFLQGRVHHYEGHAVSRVVFGVQMLAELGVKTLVITNAAGGIAPAMRQGDLMLIEGHLAFVPLHRSGVLPSATRTQTLPRLWSPRLLQVAEQQACVLRIHRGVYAMMSGPTYETPAEVKMLKHLGADAVGMSTVPEALAAADCGMEVLGVSCITNAASGLADGPLSHEEVGEVAKSVDRHFADWLFRVLNALP